MYRAKGNMVFSTDVVLSDQSVTFRLPAGNAALAARSSRVPRRMFSTSFDVRPMRSLIASGALSAPLLLSAAEPDGGQSAPLSLSRSDSWPSSASFDSPLKNSKVLQVVVKVSVS